MNKIVLAYLAIFLVPLNVGADIIFFKDGMKTVCEHRAWEEGKEVKCEYQGLILTYQMSDIDRIEKIEIEKPPTEIQMPSETTPGVAKKMPEIKPPSSKKNEAAKKELQGHADNTGSLNSTGLEFYNPRRPHKYWTSKSAKHNTFDEAVAALAEQYGRSPEWIQHHMGTTNDLAEIHHNLTNRKQDTAAKIQEDDNDKPFPEILFYDPRRSHKYWTSTTAKYNSFKEAIAALAEKYERSTDWVQKHMGNTNNLSEIHQNLANKKSAESSQ